VTPTVTATPSPTAEAGDNAAASIDWVPWVVLAVLLVAAAVIYLIVRRPRPKPPTEP
jgi:hypothetical protein